MESGIPPFRGENGLWQKVNPDFLEITNFLSHPEKSWPIIKEIFYDFMGDAIPNLAHQILAKWESKGVIQCTITQNIDNLHQRAGSKIVHEFHGTAGRMICLDCHHRYESTQISLQTLPPQCPDCVIGRIKPDFIFFGEEIPEPARSLSFVEAEKSDVFLVIGTTGEVMPASMIPQLAAQNGAKVIEINTTPSAYTRKVSDIFLQGRASEILAALDKILPDDSISPTPEDF